MGCQFIILGLKLFHWQRRGVCELPAALCTHMATPSSVLCAFSRASYFSWSSFVTRCVSESVMVSVYVCESLSLSLSLYTLRFACGKGSACCTNGSLCQFEGRQPLFSLRGSVGLVVVVGQDGEQAGLSRPSPWEQTGSPTKQANTVPPSRILGRCRRYQQGRS